MPPVAPPPPGSIHDQNDIGIYQHEGKLVVELGATVPMFCARCGGPAQHRILKRYAMSFSGSAKVDMPVCGKHRGIRRRLYLATWMAFLLSFALFYFAASKSSGHLAWAGLALLLTSLVLALFATNYLGLPSRIDRDYVWIKGVSRKFVERFPPFV
jgi:hypothetical protein